MRETADSPGSSLKHLPRTLPDGSRTSVNLRHLLESSEVPFVSVEYAPRMVIYRQGDTSDDVLYIERGEVLLAVAARTGQQAICGVLGVGAFLGEESLIGQSVRRQSAIALIAARVLVIAKAHFLHLLHTQPALADRFIGHLVTRQCRLEIDLTDQLLYPAEQRLAHTLMVLAGCDARRPCHGVLPDISQEVIAEMVGTTRSRVNRFMGKFKKSGFLEELGGRLYVVTSRLPAVRGDRRRVAGAAPASRPFIGNALLAAGGNGALSRRDSSRGRVLPAPGMERHPKQERHRQPVVRNRVAHAMVSSVASPAKSSGHAS